MSLRFQRLLLILLTLVIILSAVLLILYNTKENVSYFYTPSEIDKSDIMINKIIRIGGFVENNSFNKFLQVHLNLKLLMKKHLYLLLSKVFFLIYLEKGKVQ